MASIDGSGDGLPPTKMTGASAVPVTLVDEKLSSVEAEEMSRDIPGDFRKRKTFLDALAAQVILQKYFEHS